MTDPFVPGSMIEKFGLREGVGVRAWSRPAASSKARGCAKSSTSTACRPRIYRNVKTFRSS
jgi:hypothetical protein